MNTHIIEQHDFETGEPYHWIGIDEETARALFENGIGDLFFVRETAEGMIEDEAGLEEAIGFNAVGIDGSWLWQEEYEEGAQNRFRNNDNRSFEQWVEDKINSLL